MLEKIYNLSISIIIICLKGLSFFNSKIKLFVQGRKELFKQLKSLDQRKKTIWFHCSSLGEFEQGVPLIQACKKKYSEYQILITFFSPSGYLVKKNDPLASLICYLPFDQPKQVSKFLDIVNPKLVIFIKYDFWPNLLSELKQREILTLLVSGIFRPSQLFFKPGYIGKWMQKLLSSFSYLFVQNQDSKDLLEKINITDVDVLADTRFDRVKSFSSHSQKLDFMEKFSENSTLLVAGSTWKKDHDTLVDFCNYKLKDGYKIVIAPHKVEKKSIYALCATIKKPYVLYTEIKNTNLEKIKILVLDTIGILTSVYSYADIAYVGGGYTKSGVHSTLEPAAYGIPIIIGPNYKKFKEVKDLIYNKACFKTKNTQEAFIEISHLFQNEKARKKAGRKASDYVNKNIGATKKIMTYISKIIS